MYHTGAGGFGLSLALTAYHNGHTVTVWNHSQQTIAKIRRDGERRDKLPGVPIPEKIALTTDLACASDCELLLFAVPSRHIRELARQVSPYVQAGTTVVNASKGLEEQTFLTMSQVLHEEIPQAAVGTITGPSHAEEVGREIPTTVVAASASEETAALIQDIFHQPCPAAVYQHRYHWL